MKRKSLATSQVVEFWPHKFYYGVLRDALWASTCDHPCASTATTTTTTTATTTSSSSSNESRSSATTASTTTADQSAATPSINAVEDHAAGEFATFFHPKTVRCIPIDDFIGGSSGSISLRENGGLNLAQVVRFCRFVNRFAGAHANDLDQAAYGEAGFTGTSSLATTPACSPTTGSPVQRRRNLSISSSSQSSSLSPSAPVSGSSNRLVPMQPNEPSPFGQHDLTSNEKEETTSKSPRQTNGLSLCCFHHRRHGEFEFEAVFLICCWRVLCLKLSASDALACFEQCHLRECWLRQFDMVNTLQAMEKSFDKQMLCTSLEDMNLLEWQHFQQPQNGAIAWITRRLLICDAKWKTSTQLDASHASSFRSGAETTDVTPEQLTAYYRQRSVALIVRINAQPSESYDDKKFVSAGIQHLDLDVVSDESLCMDPSSVHRFLEACESLKPGKVVAIHSSRTSNQEVVLIGCFLMKHFQFTAAEAIHWIQFCRSQTGSISQVLSGFLQFMESKMWLDGAEYLRQQEENNSKQVATIASRRADGGSGDLSSRSFPLQISIGNISLGGKSLLGTLDANEFDVDRFHVSSHNEQARRDGSNGNSTLHTFKRRPFTQGARRLHETGGNGSGNGDSSPVEMSKSESMRTSNFAAMHKFLHHTSSPATSPSGSGSSASTSASVNGSSSSVPTRSVTIALPVSCASSLASAAAGSSVVNGSVTKLTKTLPILVNRSASTAPDISLASQLH